MAVREGGERAGVLLGAAAPSKVQGELPGDAYREAAPRTAAEGRARPRARLAGAAGGGLGTLLVALTVAIFADVLAPRGYDDQDLAFALQPPVWAGGTWSNALGTDPLGRDVLSRIVYGARTSLLLALGSVLIAAAIGVTLGLVSGWAGGRLDAAIMSTVEAQLSLPYLLFAQRVRVSVLSMKTREFVTVAVALGARGRRILFRHIAPNVIAPALVVS